MAGSSTDNGEPDLIQRIVALSSKCADFWRNAQGWAPQEAADLLSASRLDWQVSLSEALRHWVEPHDKELTSGELILAWANLGALVEGACKLFFSVYYLDYQNDEELLKQLRAFDHKKETHKSPATLGLEFFRSYMAKKGLFDTATTDFVSMVQRRRNAIHAFEDRDIGTTAEFREAVRTYLGFLEDVELRLPYPEWQ